MRDNIKRGQVWWYKPARGQHGSIQGGPRPVIIVSNNKCNQHSPILLVVPCTASIKKDLPTHVIFSLDNRINVAMTEQAGPIAVDELVNFRCTLTDEVMKKVDRALFVAFGLRSQPTEEERKDVIS